MRSEPSSIASKSCLALSRTGECQRWIWKQSRSQVTSWSHNMKAYKRFEMRVSVFRFKPALSQLIFANYLLKATHFATNIFIKRPSLEKLTKPTESKNLQNDIFGTLKMSSFLWYHLVYKSQLVSKENCRRWSWRLGSLRQPINWCLPREVKGRTRSKVELLHITWVQSNLTCI